VLPLLVCFQCLVFTTSSPTTVAVRSAQEYLIQLLDAHKIAYTVVDCGEPANKDLRTAAWGVSGKRAVFPQLFSRADGGALAFLGDWDAISAASESNEDLHGLDRILEGLPRGGGSNSAQHEANVVSAARAAAARQ
jgi:hypothetical protein